MAQSAPGIDPRSLAPEPLSKDWAEPLRSLKHTAFLQDMRAEEFAAVFLAGGHGTMFDLPHNKDLQRLVGEMAEAEKVIAAVCHGPAGLVNVRLPDGLPLVAELFFMYTTMLIAVPTGVKVFNWITTLFRGSITFEPPMLFALAFVVLFTIGGFSGLMLAIAPADFQYHDTYFVVAHFHYVLVPGAVFAIMAGVYYWLPKWTGHYPNVRLSQWHFWLSVIGVNLTFFPMHFSGLAGMPRRIPDYALQFADFNLVSSLGAFLFGASQLVFVAVVILCVRGGEKAPAKAWEGAEDLEWSVPSPAPLHTFETPPTFSPHVH